MLNPSTASRSGKALVPPGLGHRESAMLDPSGPAPGRLFGERSARILCSRSRVRGTEPSRFLGRKQLEKPEIDTSITARMFDY